MAYQGTSLCPGVSGKDAAKAEYHSIFFRVVSIEFEKKNLTVHLLLFLHQCCVR